jgi:hypothetical protein
MELWKQVLALTLTPALVIAVLGYLIRTLLQNGINRELERFKSELEIQRFQFETRFSIIHERRAEILGEIYSRVDVAQRALSDLTSPLQLYDGRAAAQKKQAAQLAGKEMSSYYSSKKIYLDEDLCSQLDEMVGLMHDAWVAFDTAQSNDPIQPNDKSLQAVAWKTVSQKLPPLKTALEKRFREELGSGCQANEVMGSDLDM